MPPTYEAWGVPAVICGLLFNAILGGTAAFLGRRYSDSVSPLWANGDVHAAVMASRKARAWLIASGVLDVLGIILAIVIFTHTSSSNYNNPSAVAASLKTLVQQRISDSSGPDYLRGCNRHLRGLHIIGHQYRPLRHQGVHWGRHHEDGNNIRERHELHHELDHCHTVFLRRPG